MYPHFYEHLANQRRDELLRDAQATRLLKREELLSSIANNRGFLLYLLFGLPLPASKPPERALLLDQAHFNAALRVIGLVALALGVLAGSLLDSRFGLAPAVLVDGAVAMVMMVLALSRSIGLRKTRVFRHTH
jgi:hypothetical protein